MTKDKIGENKTQFDRTQKIMRETVQLNDLPITIVMFTAQELLAVHMKLSSMSYKKFCECVDDVKLLMRFIWDEEEINER